MKAIISRFVLVLMIIGHGVACAQERDEPVAGSSTVQRSSAVASVQARPQQPTQIIEDLQKIVVLCASGEYTPELDNAWKEYLRKHYTPDADLDALLEDVNRRAKAYRAAVYLDSRQSANAADVQMSSIMKTMHDTAKAVISNMR